MTPNEIAEENLRKLCGVTGASYSPDHKSYSPVGNPEYPGPWVSIVMGEYVYYILAGHIRRETTRGFYGYSDATCYYIYPNAPMPSAEVIASALLLLRNDPSIFSKWCLRDARPYA